MSELYNFDDEKINELNKLYNDSLNAELSDDSLPKNIELWKKYTDVNSELLKPYSKLLGDSNEYFNDYNIKIMEKIYNLENDINNDIGRQKDTILKKLSNFTIKEPSFNKLKKTLDSTDINYTNYNEQLNNLVGIKFDESNLIKFRSLSTNIITKMTNLLNSDFLKNTGMCHEFNKQLYNIQSLFNTMENSSIKNKLTQIINILDYNLKLMREYDNKISNNSDEDTLKYYGEYIFYEDNLKKVIDFNSYVNYRKQVLNDYDLDINNKESIFYKIRRSSYEDIKGILDLAINTKETSLRTVIEYFVLKKKCNNTIKIEKIIDLKTYIKMIEYRFLSPGELELQFMSEDNECKIREGSCDKEHENYKNTGKISKKCWYMKNWK
jgi:hypothetical protein